MGYSYALNSAEAAAVTTSGWILSAYMRVVDAGHKFDGRVGASPCLLFNNGETDFVLGFARENATSGDLIVQVAEGSIANPDGSYTSTGRQAIIAGDAYHLFELVYNPYAGSADLFIDGVELISDYDGQPYNLRGVSVAFGACETPAYGRAHYNQVNLTTIPEPATLVLLALGGLAVLKRR